MKDSSLVTNNPPAAFIQKHKRIQGSVGIGRPDRPGFASGVGKQDSSVFTNRPAMRVINEEDVCEIITTAMGKASPGESAVVGPQDKAISTRSPTNRLIGKVNRTKPRARANINRQPDVAAVSCG